MGFFGDSKKSEKRGVLMGLKAFNNIIKVKVFNVRKSKHKILGMQPKSVFL